MTTEDQNLTSPAEPGPAAAVRLDALPLLRTTRTPGDPELLRQLRLFHLSLTPPVGDTGEPMRPLPAPPMQVAAGGLEVDLDRATPMRMLLAAIDSEHVPARNAFLSERATAARILRGILDTERAKRPEGRDEETMKESLGTVGTRFINPGALAGVLGEARGSVPMDPAHVTRISDALDRLGSEIPAENTDPILVHDGCLDDLPEDGLQGWQVIRHDDPCAAATAAFDLDAERLAAHLRDVRLARLEERGAYKPATHDPWLSQFGWQSFSLEERLLLRPVVAVLTREHAAEGGMQSLSSLLLSGRPMQVMIMVEPASLPEVGSDSRFGSRFEPGYLGISHRDTLVWQSTPSHPAHLREGFVRGLGAGRTTLHVVGMPHLGADDPTALEAAVTTRAHPLFSYDPELGGTWARRFSFGENPEPTSDWPTLNLAVRSEKGDEITMKMSSTFADHALGVEANRAHYCAVPEETLLEELVPLDEYFTLPDDQAPTKVPYIWAVDPKGQLRRLVLSRVLTLVTRDRLDFWRTLEELAGVRNEYVETARTQVRAAMEVKSSQEREALLAAHGEEVDRIRREATEAAVNRMTATLLGEDAGVLASPAAAATAAAAPASNPGPAAAPPAAAPEEPAASAAEATTAPAVETPAEPEPASAPVEDMDPYIDTPLCTTCNECTEMNPLMFAYDDDKKAYILDANAGPFRDLVVAAEKCTAKIIHPGTPLNPDEPNLEDLIRRAAPFNV